MGVCGATHADWELTLDYPWGLGMPPPARTNARRDAYNYMCNASIFLTRHEREVRKELATCMGLKDASDQELHLTKSSVTVYSTVAPRGACCRGWTLGQGPLRPAHATKEPGGGGGRDNAVGPRTCKASKCATCETFRTADDGATTLPPPPDP